MTVSWARFLLVAASLLAVAGCTPSTPAEAEVTATLTERPTMTRAEFHGLMDDTMAGTNLVDPDYDGMARTICGDFEARLDGGTSTNQAFAEMVAEFAYGPIAQFLDPGEVLEMSAWAVLYECPELGEGADLDG